MTGEEEDEGDEPAPEANWTIFSWICFKGDGGGAGLGRVLPQSWRRACTCSVRSVFCANLVILEGKVEDVADEDDGEADGDGDEFVVWLAPDEKHFLSSDVAFLVPNRKLNI